jgi:nucleotide-binding universal stress UspA family protein
MKNVVACIDGSNITPAVCDYASWASQRLNVPLYLLHVLDDMDVHQHQNLSGHIGLGSREALLQELTALDEKRGKIALESGRLMLESAKVRALASGVEEIHIRQRHGDLVDTLIELQEDIRLLVMGKRGSQGDTLGNLIGSNIERVVRTMHRPILVTPQTYRPINNFMIAYDGSATTRKGIEMMASSPLLKGLSCRLVMVGEKTPENEAQLEWAESVLKSAGFEPVVEIIKGEVKTALCQYRDAHDVDMLVMGAYGHSKIRQFFIGSTTTKMIQHTSTIPLLLLR